MIDAGKCFLCAKKLRIPGLLGWLMPWRSRFHYAAALATKGGVPYFIMVPLCDDDYDSIKTDKEVVTAMIEAKLIAKGDL